MSGPPTSAGLDGLHSPLSAGVVTVVCPDPLLLGLALEAVRAACPVPADDDFNQERHDGRDGIATALQAARSFPMMADCRWVGISHVDALDEAEVEALKAYLDAPSDTTVLCCWTDKLDKRGRLYKALRAHYYRELPVPTQRELPGWVRERAGQHELTIELDAAGLLAEVIGPNLMLIERALEQLACYIQPQRHVEVAAVEELICRSRSASIFELTEALGARRLGQALALVRRMEADGEAPLMVLAMIARHYRQLLRVKRLGASRLSDGALAGQLGVPPGAARALATQARQYALPQLLAVFGRLRDTDLHLKRGGHGFAALEELALTLGQEDAR